MALSLASFKILQVMRLVGPSKATRKRPQPKHTKHKYPQVTCCQASFATRKKNHYSFFQPLNSLPQKINLIIIITIQKHNLQFISPSQLKNQHPSHHNSLNLTIHNSSSNTVKIHIRFY
jgi:hypothetical protein